jgi:hypothetical protein
MITGKSTFFFYLMINRSIHDDLDAQATQIWTFQRYELVYEFFHKPLLAPPFTYIPYAFMVLKSLVGVVSRLIIRLSKNDKKKPHQPSVTDSELPAEEKFGFTKRLIKRLAKKDVCFSKWKFEFLF